MAVQPKSILVFRLHYVLTLSGTVKRLIMIAKIETRSNVNIENQIDFFIERKTIEQKEEEYHES